MITTRNLIFNFNKATSFAFPDLDCKPSETLVITGNSGVGKTTLLHLLSGLIIPKKGNIVINEVDITTLSASELDRFRGKNIGVILQQSHFIASLSVLENVVLASLLASSKKAIDKAKKLLIQLGLENQMHKLPSQLSVGQQQRVSIARALINEPKLLLADEPTSSLDDTNSIIVANLLKELAQEYQASLVIVTHDNRLKDVFSNQINLN